MSINNTSYQKLNFLSNLITRNINRIIKLDPEASDLMRPLENKKLWFYIEDFQILISLYIDNTNIKCDCIKYKNHSFENDIFIKKENKKNELLIYGKSKYFIELARTKNPQDVFNKSYKLNYHGSFNILLAAHKFYNQLDLDIENIMPYFLGDHLGGFLAQKSKDFINKSKESCTKNKEKWIDYLEREKRVLVPKEEVEDWIEDIYNLQKDLDRLEAKIHKARKR